MTMHAVRLGLVLGLLLGAFHACWAGLVAAGWAQPLMDFVFWAHFITPPYRIEPFEPARALILIGFTFSAGFVLGLGGGLLWNRFARAR